MGVCDKMRFNMIFILSFVLLLLFVNLINSQEEVTYEFNDTEENFGSLIGEGIENDNIFGKNVLLKKGETNEIIFTEDDSYLGINGDLFENVKPGVGGTNAFLKLNEEGKITHADLTASDDASFVFDERKIEVKKGTRMIYTNGYLNVWGQESEEIKLFDKVTNNGVVSFENEHKITLLNSGERISVIDGENVFGGSADGFRVEGNNFIIDKLTVRRSPKFYGLSGTAEVFVGEDGYVLGQDVVGVKDGISFSTGGLVENNLLISESGEWDLGKYNNWVVLGDKTLKAEGRGFDMTFLEDNPYVEIEEGDNFRIKSIRDLNVGLRSYYNDFSLELENRKVPRMTLGGTAAVTQGKKSLFINNGNVYSSNFGGDYMTIPVELLVKDLNTDKYSDKKYLISNSNEISVVPFEQEIDFTEERDENSIEGLKSLAKVFYIF